jgi:hypothetical protein
MVGGSSQLCGTACDGALDDANVDAMLGDEVFDNVLLGKDWAHKHVLRNIRIPTIIPSPNTEISLLFMATLRRKLAIRKG